MLNETQENRPLILPYIVQKWRYNPNVKRIILADSHTPNVLHEWSTDYCFYAFSPFFRPIPRGMNLFEIKHSEVWPYGLQSIKAVYNIFLSDPTSIYFIAYSVPVNGTRELDASLTARCNYDEAKNNTHCRNIYVLEDNVNKFKNTKAPGFDLCVPNKDGEEIYKCVFKHIQYRK